MQTSSHGVAIVLVSAGDCNITEIQVELTGTFPGDRLQAGPSALGKQVILAQDGFRSTALLYRLNHETFVDGLLFEILGVEQGDRERRTPRVARLGASDRDGRLLPISVPVAGDRATGEDPPMLGAPAPRSRINTAPR